jgi:hypothetical protein
MLYFYPIYVYVLGIQVIYLPVAILFYCLAVETAVTVLS